MKKENIHIGCSAFNNTYWKKIFYPDDLPRSKWFDFYASQFSTYELNGTFYKAPTVKSLKTWYDKVPVDFLFSVKAPKLITHYKKFKDCKNDIDEFYAICREGLQEKLACVLFQLPPSYDYSEEKLELIINSVNPDFKNVVEFRHKSWWNEAVFKIFAANNITFCSVSYDKLPSDLIETNSIGYVRLHGVPRLFYSEYAQSELQKLHDDIRKYSFNEIFVYFNNTASEAGILNAVEMKKLER